MTARRIAEVILRVWATLLFVQSLLALPSLLTYRDAIAASAPEGQLIRASLIGGSAGLLLAFVISALLFAFAPAISTRLVASDQTISLQINAAQVFLIALSLLGIYVLIGGAERLATVAYTLASKSRWDETPGLEYLWDRQRQAIPAALIETAAGSALLYFRVRLTSALLGVSADPNTGSSN